ncbi:MAG: FKBP-type peptidyl-prolyl cis-trans isomerase [Saprospiraceae bacterium]|nr:FKBP-type peptidyl-prolyl cis-trans isomerase [Saprospiraceae bacterium]
MTGCIPDPISQEEQLAKDIKKIEDYLKDNNLTAESTASGLHYIIEEPGTGGHPTLDDDVTVNYKGYLLDGSVFDQTSGTPITFGLSGVILGWQEGIPLFQKGGKGTLLIPSGLAYGANPPSGIPSRAVLAFDVELVNF